MLPKPETLLGGLSAREFLRDFWQQKPLLVRQAWPGFQPLLDPETLAGLALEPEVESRLIRETADGWQLQHGPIAETTFQQLPESHWTLLVQDMDKLLPELQTVLDAFRFLPDWRLDDLMVSYAATGGSVGAHVDQYDVFLLQASGTRRWDIDRRPGAPLPERDDVPLRQLRQFEASDSWVLKPGDMLYLPPGVPHLGVALDPCMTFSIGFRAPTDEELLAELLQTLLESGDQPTFFTDPGRAPCKHPAVLDNGSLRRARELIRLRLARLDDRHLDRIFARTVTQGKPGFEDRAPDSSLSMDQLRQQLTAGCELSAHPALRVALLDDLPAGWCFIEGEEYRLDTERHAMLRTLTARRTVNGEDLLPWIDQLDCMTLLLELINQGHWELVGDEHE